MNATAAFTPTATFDRTTNIANAIDAGHTTQKQLIAVLGLAKTTLINTLAKMIDAGDVIRTADAQGKVTYSLPQPPAAPVKGSRINQATIITDFLFANIGQSFTPHQITKATGHKGLRDACARLATAGKIAKTSDAPAAYAFDYALLG